MSTIPDTNQPTCTRCMKPMRYNVPRMGPAGGYVHSDTGRLACDSVGLSSANLLSQIKPMPDYPPGVIYEPDPRGGIRAVRRSRGVRVQWCPNLVAAEKRICLTRIRWETGTVGDGDGYSSKLSVSLVWEPRDLWVGLFCEAYSYSSPKRRSNIAWYLCLLPCLPIRFKLVRSYGGIIP